LSRILATAPSRSTTSCMSCERFWPMPPHDVK
jgi:hypothetical protein